MSKENIFEGVLSTIVDDSIRGYATKCIATIPPYFYEVGASSSGKHHPAYALGKLGLARHTVAVVRFLNYFLGLNCIGMWFSPRKKDLMRVACIMHDSRKSGNQNDWEADPATKFNHPLLAAEVVLGVDSEGISQRDKRFVARCIKTHMGQWTTSKYSAIVLPKPRTLSQRVVHTADYLASRKDITLSFDE